ncbi:DUF1847 domain-containing protein [Thermodesulfobacteriota bacterium]
MKCAPCPEKKCNEGKDCTGLKAEIRKKYSSDDLKMMKISDELVKKYYMKKTRIEELIYFAKKMKYGRLGLAFCIGLRNEADVLHKILSKDFNVYSAVCKVCGIDKCEFKAVTGEKNKKASISCNPAGQAEMINKKKTDLNISFGLCLGHDILFEKYSQAPVTTLVVKDRVMANNPIGAIYSGYYRTKKFKLKD